MLTLRSQLLLRCTTRYFPAGSIIADSRERANGLMVITSGKVIDVLNVIYTIDVRFI